MRKTMIATLVLFGLTAMPAAADTKPTVESLVTEGYEVISVFPSTAGPGMLLEYADDSGVKLMMCFVAETPQSPDITTQYCKPVH